MTDPALHPPAGELGTTLRAAHEALDDAFERLTSAFAADPRSVGVREWRSFEAALEAHMRLEEELVLPDFAKTHAEAAQVLALDHAGIRADLEELGLGVELGLVPKTLIDRFVQRLKMHARREDLLLYRYADVGLDELTRRRATNRARDLTPPIL